MATHLQVTDKIGDLQRRGVVDIVRLTDIRPTDQFNLLAGIEAYADALPDAFANYPVNVQTMGFDIRLPREFARYDPVGSWVYIRKAPTDEQIRQANKLLPDNQPRVSRHTLKYRDFKETGVHECAHHAQFLLTPEGVRHLHAKVAQDTGEPNMAQPQASPTARDAIRRAGLTTHAEENWMETGADASARYVLGGPTRSPVILSYWHTMEYLLKAGFIQTPQEPVRREIVAISERRIAKRFTGSIAIPAVSSMATYIRTDDGDLYRFDTSGALDVKRNLRMPHHEAANAFLVAGSPIIINSRQFSSEWSNASIREIVRVPSDSEVSRSDSRLISALQEARTTSVVQEAEAYLMASADIPPRQATTLNSLAG